MKRDRLLSNPIIAVLFVALTSFLLSSSVNAASGTFNEFKLQAANFDDLKKNAKNCTSLIDETVSLIYCESGFFAIEATNEYVNTFSAFGNNANKTIDLKGKPQDV